MRSDHHSEFSSPEPQIKLQTPMKKEVQCEKHLEVPKIGLYSTEWHRCGAEKK